MPFTIADALSAPVKKSGEEDETGVITPLARQARKRGRVRNREEIFVDGG